MVVMRPISPLAWLPLGLVLFRKSEPAALFAIAVCSMWPTVINTMAGVRAAHIYNVFRYGHPASVEARFLRDLAAAPRVPTTSIYSRSDGVVNWKACLRPDLNAIEVEGSHIGLALNPDVYRILAYLLPAPWSPT